MFLADARVAPRSGLAVKHGIATGAGVVDEDYRGEVRVLLFNHGDADFEIQAGDRIAQMVLERIVTPEVKVMEELEESVRGAGGFGSTGGFGGQA
jgi:dUTP pyrophosphatase